MNDWEWTWEERTPAATEAGESEPSPPPPPSRPVPPGRGNEDIYRRRRATALLTLLGAVALITVLIVVITAGGGQHHKTAPVALRRSQVRRLSDAEREALEIHDEEEAIDRVLSYTPAVTSGGNRGNEVALTFDDGPGPYTAQVVETLNRLHVKATFFAIGSQEQYFSAGTIAELRSGDVVGNHTESHPMLATLSRHDQHEQLFEQSARIELLGGPKPRLFRPPYGSFNATTWRVLHSMHLLMVLWSTDTDDYRLPGVEVIVQTALAGARPGAIILMHDGGGDRSETVAALPAIIHGLRERGLHPVTVPRLMLDDPPAPGSPIPHSLAGD